MCPFFRSFLSFRFWRRLLVGGVLAYVGVALTLGGRPEARPVFHGLTLAWLAVLVASSCRRAGREEARPHRAVLLGELIATNLALTLLLAEFSLRAFAALAGTSPVLSDALDAYRLQPGHDYGGGLRGNQLGYPGPDFRRAKRPGVVRIAALGDSFAVGPAVPFADNYLTLLERRLPGVEVYNFGLSGAGPREYRAILQADVWTYQPDLVLLSVFVGNDITETLATPRHLDPRQSALYLLLTRGWRLARARDRQPGALDATGERRLPAAGLSPQRFREVEARRLAVCLRPVADGVEKKWRRALRDLAGVAADCRRRGVPLAVVLIPDEFQVNPDVLAEAVRESGVAAGDVDLTLPQRRLAAFFARHEVPCLDLMRALARSGGTYAPRDTHWNVRGNRLAAAEVARWLGTAFRETLTR